MPQSSKNITKSWIELQNVHNCTATKISKNLLIFRKYLWVAGHEDKKLVALGFSMHFPLKSKS